MAISLGTTPNPPGPIRVPMDPSPRVIIPVQRGWRTVSRPVGGVLSSGPFPGARWVTIHLSGAPGDLWAGHPSPFRPCSGWGLPSRPGRPGRWCALTAPFHPYLCGAAPETGPAIGGLFSVALSCGSPRLGVTQHPALWSPDVPRPGHRRVAAVGPDAAAWPTHHGVHCGTLPAACDPSNAPDALRERAAPLYRPDVESG